MYKRTLNGIWAWAKDKGQQSIVSYKEHTLKVHLTGSRSPDKLLPVVYCFAIRLPVYGKKEKKVYLVNQD